jgi:hypothetical protein
VEELVGPLTVFGISAGIFVLLGGVIFLTHMSLLRLFTNHPGRQHYRQILFISISVFMLLVAVMLLPLAAATQGQLLTALGLLIGAAIALSSSKPLGNALAGISFRSACNCRVGDHIEVGKYVGHITRMDLLGIEMHTEQNDLVSLPNLYLLATPVRVSDVDDDLLHLDVSLGYAVPRRQIEALLLQAAAAVELQQAVVEIGELGDNSVTYRVCGRAVDIRDLTACELRLKACVLDGLQALGKGRVEPDTRSAPAVATTAQSAPAAPATVNPVEAEPAPDIGAADRKKQTGTLNELKREYTDMSQQLIEAEQALRQADQGEARKPLSLEKKKLEARLLRVEKEIAKVEATLSAA